MTTLLYALGLDQEGIMDAYYDTVDYTLDKKGQTWSTKFFPERVRGTRPAFDLVDAATGEVIGKAGEKVTPRSVKKLIDEGAKFNEVDSAAFQAATAGVYDKWAGEIGEIVPNIQEAAAAAASR